MAGVADAVRARGIACFGPSAGAARLEGCKAFAKEVMAAAGVPTADARLCLHDADEAVAALDEFGPPYVVKDDGLAAGKGVVVTGDRDAAIRPRGRLSTGWSSRSSSTAPRCRLFAISDGSARAAARSRPRTSSGSATATPAPTPAAWAPTRRCRGRRPAWSRRSSASVLQPTVDEMRAAGHPVRRAALRRARAHLARAAGGRVQRPLRRPGDPAAAGPAGDPAGRGAARPRPPARSAGHAPLEWGSGAAVARRGGRGRLPEAPRRGDVITGSTPSADGRHPRRHGAGRRRPLVSAGGRVLAVVGTGANLAEARDDAYAKVAGITPSRRLPPHRHRPDSAADHVRFSR